MHPRRDSAQSTASEQNKYTSIESASSFSNLVLLYVFGEKPEGAFRRYSPSQKMKISIFP